MAIRGLVAVWLPLVLLWVALDGASAQVSDNYDSPTTIPGSTDLDNVPSVDDHEEDMGEENGAQQNDAPKQAEGPKDAEEQDNQPHGDGAPLPAEVHTDFFVESKKQRLRVGTVWGMPGLYSSDGQPRDLVLGAAAGRKIYFGIERNDAWIQADTGHMWLKGSITTKKYLHTFAEKQRLRVGAVWGMPGLYASDGEDRDMILGTAAGKKIYFGTHRSDAWIESGTGHAWFKGSVTVQNFIHLFASKQRLRVGAVWDMPGLYASDGEARDMILGTAPGKKIYLGVNKEDAYVEAGAGNMWLKGMLTVNANSHFKSGGKTLRVGTVYDMPGIYSADGGAEDLSLGTTSGRKVYFGVGKNDAWIQSGTGDMWLKGGLTTESDSFFISERQKLRVGSVDGMPGLYSSDGEARDLALGTAKGRKIFFGDKKADAWIQAGTGQAWFKGSVTTEDNTFNVVAGQRLQVGAWAGIPGLYSSDGGARDLILGTAANRKVYFGSGTGDAYVTAGTGTLWTKGSIESHDNMFVYSDSNRLRVGSIWGLPGIYSSDGAPRDMMIGVAKNKKVFLGYHRDDAWVEAGTGAAFFKGEVTISNNLKLESNGAALTVGEITGTPGVSSSADGVARDMVLEAGSGKKLFLGKKDDAWVETGTGDAFFKGALTSKEVKTGGIAVTGAAVFDDSVTVKKNLILLSAGGSELNMMEEMASLRQENSELRESFAEMRTMMESMMAR